MRVGSAAVEDVTIIDGRRASAASFLSTEREQLVKEECLATPSSRSNT
jgi:hypothetical protein